MYAVYGRNTQAGIERRGAAVASQANFERRTRLFELSRRYVEDQQLAEEKRRRIIEAQTPARRAISMVATWHGVSVPDILGKSRMRHIVEARHDAIAAVWSIVRTHEGKRLSLLRMAVIFDRDHTVIIHALRRRGMHD